MAGLTDRAGGAIPAPNDTVERSHQAWQESMLRHMDDLRLAVRAKEPRSLADRCGAKFLGGEIRLIYWNRLLAIAWSDLEMRWLPEGQPCPIFDKAMILYYLQNADGAPLADRWIAYRELPGGIFYSQAFQGYSGDRLARALGERPQAFQTAAQALGGIPLPALPGEAFAFQPLPRIRLAAILYPGDEEFPARASVLFDAACSHYMTTDGLALLGAGLAGRLIKLADR